MAKNSNQSNQSKTKKAASTASSLGRVAGEKTGVVILPVPGSEAQNLIQPQLSKTSLEPLQKMHSPQVGTLNQQDEKAPYDPLGRYPVSDTLLDWGEPVNFYRP